MLKVGRTKKASLFKERRDILHREISSLRFLIANYKQVILILIRSYQECCYEDQRERLSAIKAAATTLPWAVGTVFPWGPKTLALLSWVNDLKDHPPFKETRQIGRQAEALFSLILCAWGRRRKTLVVLDCEYFHFMTEARWSFTVSLEKLHFYVPWGKMKHVEFPPFTSRNM